MERVVKIPMEFAMELAGWHKLPNVIDISIRAAAGQFVDENSIQEAIDELDTVDSSRARNDAGELRKMVDFEDLDDEPWFDREDDEEEENDEY